MLSPSSLVENVDSLISFPDVALRVNQLVNDPDSSAADIASTIESDPAITAKLLRVSNSAMMNNGTEITDINRAITRLGLRQVNELLMGIDVSQSFDKMPNQIVSLTNFWQHSLYCAVIARKLATQIKCDQANSAFSAGLLHDIGHLIMFSRAPDASEKALTLSLEDYDDSEIFLAEQETLGFDHSDVGLELARHWNLPQILQDCIYAHHEPYKLENPATLVWVIHIANSFAVLAEINSENIEDASKIKDEAWEVTGLSPAALPDCIAFARESVEDILSSFSAN
ncbi:HDOD domain-containing protein [Spongiibacter sp. KMU-158]|uniref:HDOD domain-containing protein n=1 Tax=Spongiibacter pelagi TaxID=2760804 RepID=A0A927C1W5_9GAMM|nr:HDOD domain-containing protein [Spongiibacter pelagi]MBD2858131.1 HDOD domain-containing protein [Spongiibacter pelagi]